MGFNSLVKADLAAYLDEQNLLVQDTAVWGNGRLPLQIACYQVEALPPLHFVTSVRAVLFQGNRVMVVRGGHGSYHIVPGGQREAGESLTQTLRREILEETGWTLVEPRLAACVHFHHLAARPDGYPYPYPDFLQLVFTAEASMFKPEAQIEGLLEIETGFLVLADAKALLLSAYQRVLLAAAVKLHQFTNPLGGTDAR